MTEVERLTEAIRPELYTIRHDLRDLRSLVEADDKIGNFLIERIELAMETTLGCIVLARGDLAYPVATLARNMLELTIGTFWAASSPERAAEASGASVAELMRIMKTLLAKGHAKIVNKRTGEDKTGFMREAIEKRNIGRRRQIAELARECGLGHFYDRFYPMQSMPSHGHSMGLSGGRGEQEGLYAMMVAVRAHLKAIHFIVAKQIRQKQPTTIAELDGFLMVGLVRPADRTSGAA
jgi:hypothetical protein